jgi:hypothetical protein
MRFERNNVFQSNQTCGATIQIKVWFFFEKRSLLKS